MKIEDRIKRLERMLVTYLEAWASEFENEEESVEFGPRDRLYIDILNIRREHE